MAGNAVADFDRHLVGAVAVGIGRRVVVRLRRKEIGGHHGEVEAQHTRGLVDAEAVRVRARQAPAQQLPVRLGRRRVGGHPHGLVLRVCDRGRPRERGQFDDVLQRHRQGRRVGVRTVAHLHGDGVGPVAVGIVRGLVILGRGEGEDTRAGQREVVRVRPARGA